MGEISADSFGWAAGFDRAGARRRVLRGVDLAVVLAVVDFEASGFLAVSDAVEGFSAVSDPVATARGSETGARVDSTFVIFSAGGSAIVAPTEETRFVPRLERGLSAVDSVASATGIPPLNGSKLPLK